MSKEEFNGLPFNSPEREWYKYRCLSCGHKQDVEDIVFDAYYHSKGCKKGESPKLTCPECHGDMECFGSFKSAPEGR